MVRLALGVILHVGGFGDPNGVPEVKVVEAPELHGVQRVVAQAVPELRTPAISGS
ncbi:hypothetical protein DPMN_139321 [Dreissena polymorpha]|uniref:Uncharacterized protein n=1 Tax=Dreissena polymorpha TaxID=45954 RepID=A0A9D4JKN7_DREPO|nr:hypothetical protein DPMN_133041 [Dreissena polymorpha]KAH3810922.1 hypothetical protein DPMN_139321 [Dreissena polymorpha]